MAAADGDEVPGAQEGAASSGRGTGRVGAATLLVLVALCAGTLSLGYLNKARCAGPEFGPRGATTPDLQVRFSRDVCYSDIQSVWGTRDLLSHQFPYVNGSISDEGLPVDGVYEYPVLTGVLIWLGSLPVHTDAGYLLATALLLAPFGLATAWLLGRLTRWRALLWAIGPPLGIYALHNWELPVVLTSVAAVYVLHRGWGRRGAQRPLEHRAVAASVLLGIGCALKLYPGFFMVPLLLYVVTAGGGDDPSPGARTVARERALRCVLAALGTVVLVNLPFVLAGFEGWSASFRVQMARKADITSGSIWYWGLRPWSERDNESVQGLIGLLSPALVLASFALACYLGWRRYRREGTYPWLGVSAAMLCGFLLFHKVHSPQYTLWLLPMFVLLRIRWQWIAAYLVADLAMGIGIFRWYYELYFHGGDGITDSLAAQAVMVGVWGRAVLLVGLFFAFLGARAAFESEAAVGADAAPS